MPKIILQSIDRALPMDFEDLRISAAAEGYRFLDRLHREWVEGSNRFSRPSEQLVVARYGARIAGIGGLTKEPALSCAFRMRRFYVRPKDRRTGIGRDIATLLLNGRKPSGALVTVNAATPGAPAFWSALGFDRAAGAAGYSHILYA